MYVRQSLATTWLILPIFDAAGARYRLEATDEIVQLIATILMSMTHAAARCALQSQALRTAALVQSILFGWRLRQIKGANLKSICRRHPYAGCRHRELSVILITTNGEGAIFTLLSVIPQYQHHGCWHESQPKKAEGRLSFLSRYDCYWAVGFPV